MALALTDPFGLGIKREIPKSQIFSTEENNTFFTRSLLSEKDKALLDAEGILSIENVRSLISENMVKAQESYEGASLLDPDLLILFDSRINYKIYIIDDNVYTFEELYISFPFQEFNVIPESVMVRQDIGFFTNGDTIVVDAGDEMIAVDDLVRLATRKHYIPKNKPEKIVNSKIYIGKEKWKDFAQLHKFFRGIARISTMQIENSATPAFLKPFIFHNMNTITNGDSAVAVSATADYIDTSTATLLIELNEIKQIRDNLNQKITNFEYKLAML